MINKKPLNPIFNNIIEDREKLIYREKLISAYQKLLNRSICLCKKILYESKIWFYAGLLLNILYFLLGLMIGVRLK